MSNYGNSSGFGGGRYPRDVPPPRNTSYSFRGETPPAGGARFGADQDRRDEDYPRRESSFRRERAPSPDQRDSRPRYSYDNEDPRSKEEVIRFIARGWTKEEVIRAYIARGHSEDTVRRVITREFEAGAARQRSGSSAQYPRSSDDRYGGRDPARVDQLRQGALAMLLRQGWPEAAARARVESEIEAEFGGSEISNEEIERYRQQLLRICLESGADPRIARIAVEEQIEEELVELGRRARAGASQARDPFSRRDDPYPRPSRDYSSRSRSPPRYPSSESFPGMGSRRDRDDFRGDDRYESRSYRNPRDYDDFGF